MNIQNDPTIDYKGYKIRAKTHYSVYYYVIYKVTTSKKWKRIRSMGDYEWKATAFQKAKDYIDNYK